MATGTAIRLLWVSKETPDRHGQGGQRRQYFQLRELHRAGVELTVVTPASDQSEATVREFAEVHRMTTGRLRRRPDPDPVELTTGGAFDRIVVAHAESFGLLRGHARRIGVPWLVDFHNVNSRWYAASGDDATTAYWLPIEKEILDLADASLTCSAAETAALRRQRASATVAEAANGIAPDEWHESALGRREPGTVALFGSWWYPPNRQAIAWFRTEIWPAVLRETPARLLIAGAGEPGEDVRRTPGVSVVGRVDDLAQFLGTAAVVAVPVQRGPGTPVKFAESLASGAAVVATSAAASGNPDAPAILADDPDAFAAAIVRLLGDPHEAAQLGERGRAYALERCAWAVTQRPLVQWALTGKLTGAR